MNLLMKRGLTLLVLGGVAIDPLWIYAQEGVPDSWPTLLEVSDETGVSGYGAARGSNINDFNGDGSLDIYVSMTSAQASPDFYYSSANLMFLNDGTGHFTEAAESFGIASMCEGRSPLFGDFDNDGRGDLYLHINGYNQLFRGRPDGSLEDVTDITGVGNRGYGHQAQWIDYDHNGFIDLFLTNGPRRGSDFNVLYRNNGDGTFSDVTEKAGVLGDVQAKGAAAFDYNNDGWTDIFTTSGQDYANTLFRNNGDGTFTDVALEAGVADVWRKFGIWAVSWDYDNDGWLDLVVGNHDIYYVGLDLYHNNGDGTFTDVSVQAGVADAFNGHGFAVGDIDNDGWLDMLFSYGEKNVRMFRNSGLPLSGAPGVGFEEITPPEPEEGEVSTDEFEQLLGEILWSTWSITLGDVNEDGYLDAFVSAGTAQQPSPNLLFESVGTHENHWLHVDVQGRRGSSSALGTRVYVETEEGLRRMRVVGEYSGNTSQGSLRLEFGLGVWEEAKEVRVEFPSGEVVTVDDPEELQADQIITVVETGSSWLTDEDGDGVPDVGDACSDTSFARLTDERGCSEEQASEGHPYLQLSNPAEDAILPEPPTFSWLASYDGYRVQVSPHSSFSPEHRWEWGSVEGTSFTVPDEDWEAMRAVNIGDFWYWRVEGSNEAGSFRSEPRRFSIPVQTDVVQAPLGINLFWPGHIEVQAGANVLWFNDDAAHGNYDELTHDIELVDEGGQVVRNHQQIEPGEFVNFTFEEPGWYYYVCRIHSTTGHYTHEQALPSGGYSNAGPFECMAGSVYVRDSGDAQ